MIKFDFDQYCTGCTSCLNICPTNAIQLVANQEGFSMPVIDCNKCIDCKRCVKACPHLTTRNESEESFQNQLYKKTTFVYFSYKDSREKSASGGVFFDLASGWIKTGGYVCGCVWSDNMKAKHIISNNETDIKRMQSSKYVQSDLGKCFGNIKELLSRGHKVLFSGTPCQTAGLHAYIPSTLKQGLFVISIICHGVPSPLVWEKYKNLLENKYHAKMVDANMRDKSFKGYSTTFCKYSFGNEENRKISEYSWPTYLADPYVFLFTDNLFLRNSCHNCKYKADNSFSDMIIGDYHPSIVGAGMLGCSTVITLTEKGEFAIKSMEGYKRVMDCHHILTKNSMLWKSSDANPQRSKFFKRLFSADVNKKVFADFLPFRFYVKKILNEVGLLNIAIRIIKWIK